MSKGTLFNISYEGEYPSKSVTSNVASHVGIFTSYLRSQLCLKNYLRSTWDCPRICCSLHV